MIENNSTINRMEQFQKEIAAEIQRRESQQKVEAKDEVQKSDDRKDAVKVDASILEKLNREQMERVAKDPKLYETNDYSKLDREKLQQQKDAFDLNQINYERAQQLLS
jgi:hypothetical protein